MSENDFFIYRKIQKGYYSCATTKFKWWCTCKTGRLFGPVQNDKLIENLLMKIVPACSHLLPLLFIYESKRSNVFNRDYIEYMRECFNLSNDFIYSKLLDNISLDMKNILIDSYEKYNEIEKLFNSNISSQNIISRIQVDDILNNIIYTKYVPILFNNKWICNCKHYKLNNTCKHIDLQLKNEKKNLQIIEIVILIANKYFEDKK